MGLGRKKAKPAFSQMQEIDELERVQNRDVYDRQQLKRSKPEEMQTMTSRTILAACFGLAMMLVCYFIFSVITSFASGFMNPHKGSGDLGSGKQETVVEEQVEVNSDGIRPLSSAPDTVTVDELKEGYLTYHEADIESGNTTPYYTDYEGNIYLEGDVDVLASRVQNHEFMSADDREAARLRQLREQNGVLPLNLAPMNITLDDFYYFYFQDANPESKSMIRHYRDYEGNVYESEEVRLLWQQVQAGQLGSGKVSYLEADGGYSPDSDHLKGKVDADGNALDGTGSGLLGGFSFRDALRFRGKTFFWSFLIGLAAFGILWEFLKKNLDAQNAENDVTDINQYENDQHIQVPEELQRNYDWFPDAGAHSKVMVSGMISHMMLKKKGLKTVPVVRRAQKDIVGEDGEIAYLKGEPLLDDNGEEIIDMLPIIDEKFGDALFEASGALDDPRVRIAYDATKIPYNPGNKNREKQKGFDTVADLINNDWTFPEYEVQRPAGAYIVDVEPINTMVLAITRAGKGQTYIEPTIDMWTRELTPNNMVINDPKGELLVKFYVKGSVRGFQIVQFNLINAMKTDIYNPLMMAAQAAREGDFTKCALYVENIADVFFPTDGAEDPVWPNAANNAFKRAAYGLIDYYVEQEVEVRAKAARNGTDPKVLETEIDQMWGKVTLYNCYQLFVQLTSKKKKNPFAQFIKDNEAGKFNQGGMVPDKDGNMVMQPAGEEPLTQEEWEERKSECEKDSVLWEDKADIDLLTLYFNATDKLPHNQMRNLIANANNSLRSMAGAEKMLASVYGIAITAMSFFTDPTISTLTSGTPSQNVDLGGLSFPRRMGVRFSPDFVKKNHFMGLQCKWDSFEDPNFTKNLGKDFEHEDIVDRNGWAMYYFKGKYAKDIAYPRLRIVNPQTGMLVRTFYFEFRKSYQMSLDSRYYVKDPVLGEKIVKNGLLFEMKPVKVKSKDGSADRVVYKRAKTTFVQEKIKDVLHGGKKEKINALAITQNMVRYSDKPKMVFLVTPPHLMKYAKLILILIKQLVDLNFDKSYMTKSNQKPLYKTRFMLDELGNLQSEGHGISGFQTMLSIGLGQEQQFTLILQTLQQLKDVYGDSVDKIVQGNTSNIVFLKSTDDTMIQQLETMSGKTHEVRKDSKTITKDKERLFMQTEGKISITMSVKEKPVISYNDMAFINPRNSIVFRAGDSPIWNRNQTILPMSWKLFSDTIVQPGKNYTLQTIPTLSSALDFDVRKNQPNFQAMVEKRVLQARYADEAVEAYKKAYGYTDYDVEQLDPDVYSDEIMEIINQAVREHLAEKEGVAEEELPPEFDLMDEINSMIDPGDYEDNEEQFRENEHYREIYDDMDNMKFADGNVSPNMLVGFNGKANHAHDGMLVAAFRDARSAMFHDTQHFMDRGDGSLYGADGTLFIYKMPETNAHAKINAAMQDEGTNVYGEEDVTQDDIDIIGGYVVKDAFIIWLSKLDAWDFAAGRFEEAVVREYNKQV